MESAGSIPDYLKIDYKKRVITLSQIPSMIPTSYNLTIQAFNLRQYFPQASLINVLIKCSVLKLEAKELKR